MSTLPPPTYPNARFVFRALCAIEQSIELHSAISQRFERGEGVPDPLDPDECAVLKDLARDGFIFLPPVQSEIDRYRVEHKQMDELSQQLKSSLARKKTLQMQLRNVEQEQSKGGLFKGKIKQRLMMKSQRIQAQLTTSRQEVEVNKTRIERAEYLLRSIAEQVQKDEALRDSKWLAHEGLAVVLKREGVFLLEYLKEISFELFEGHSLPQILMYGPQWSNLIK